MALRQRDHWLVDRNNPHVNVGPMELQTAYDLRDFIVTFHNTIYAVMDEAELEDHKARFDNAESGSNPA